VRATTETKGTLTLPLPAGWQVKPASHEVSFSAAGEETTVAFAVTAPKGAGRIEAAPSFESAGRKWSFRIDVIDYAHIPMQVVLQPAALALVPISISVPKKLVGYVMGSGDSVAEDLAHVGLRVEPIDDDTLRSGDLSRFGAIVVGIRAYNTRAALKSAHERLMAYAERGGTVVVQYSTNSGWDPITISVGPYPMTIGRERTTEENAAMVALDPKSPLPFAARQSRVSAEEQRSEFELIHELNRLSAVDYP